MSVKDSEYKMTFGGQNRHQHTQEIAGSYHIFDGFFENRGFWGPGGYEKLPLGNYPWGPGGILKLPWGPQGIGPWAAPENCKNVSVWLMFHF